MMDDEKKTDQHEILVVDDTPTSLLLLTHILADHGYRVRPASNGLLALRSVMAKVPDLILLDVKMPDLDGFEVCRRLKSDERSRHIPVLFISALGESSEKVKGFEVGGLDYISKPFETEEVLARIKIHLRLGELTERLDQKVRERTVELTNANIKLQQEINERKQAEEALQEKTNELDSYFTSALDLLCIADTNGYFRKLNPEWEKTLGYSIEELQRCQFLDFVHPDDMENTIRTISSLTEQKAVLGFTNRYRHKDGTYRWIEWRSYPIGNLIYATARDITERKQAEDEIRLFNVELEQRVHARTAQLELTNKELESFAYSISHDLRTPLRAIEGYSHILLEDFGQNLDEEGQQYLIRIRANVKHMANLIDDLLRLSRVTRGELDIDSVDLSLLAGEVVNDLKGKQPGRKVNVIIPAGLIVRADENLMRIVLFDLIGNAWKYTGKCMDACIEMGMTSMDGKQVYYVKDNGIGFDMAFVGQLFKPFQRLHSVKDFEGTGIGLAMVQRIIQRHGGQIWAQSEVEKGTTFYFTLGKL